MHRLAAPRLPLGDTATVTTMEFSMGGGSQGWASMSRRLGMSIVPPGDICMTKASEALGAWWRTDEYEELLSYGLGWRVLSERTDEYEELLSYGLGWRVLSERTDEYEELLSYGLGWRVLSERTDEYEELLSYGLGWRVLSERTDEYEELLSYGLGWRVLSERTDEYEELLSYGLGWRVLSEMTDEYEELLSYGLGWRVLSVTPPGVTECGPYHGFPHVLYQLWLVGVAARHLEMMLQVDLVRHNTRTGLDWERVLSEF
ncbi:hypothetical protein DEO72_LG2g2560 [Vigna unguiculata]|uniref:Uncharacterized protein n=1 Tax=Vigna unguiculata TaxID=3917 RepID=A0A4D6L163_VIGUN|nr:hypothetical protein DEO72_LG2g2560 [Vigna unguiculata]